MSAEFAGHAYSAVPDVLVHPQGMLHPLWMDVFAYHIALHFIPVPLVTVLIVFALALRAATSAALGMRLVTRSACASYSACTRFPSPRLPAAGQHGIVHRPPHERLLPAAGLWKTPATKRQRDGQPPRSDVGGHGTILPTQR